MKFQLVCRLVSVVVLLAVTGCEDASEPETQGSSSPPDSGLDRRTLEDLEERTESFANRLLDLRLRWRRRG